MPPIRISFWLVRQIRFTWPRLGYSVFLGGPMGRSKAEKAKAHKRIVAIIRGLTASLASRMVINVPHELTSLPGGSRPTLPQSVMEEWPTTRPESSDPLRTDE